MQTARNIYEAPLTNRPLAQRGTAPVQGCKVPTLLATSELDQTLHELGVCVGDGILRVQAERAAIAAKSSLPVLLLGETGTGKERFAHMIHKLSPRRDKELIAINCAAIPKEIAESYLFGHTKGAFTGAFSEKAGVFEEANLTTLFLDEVAELTLEHQAKLLRVIQDGVVQRVGSTTPRRIDARVIAATNRDLRGEVAKGRFREDLYFRLEVIQINLPRLRDRRHDIPQLALALLRQINQRQLTPRYLSEEALQRLERHDWPGNVRQLANVLQRSVLYARGDVLAGEDLLIPEDPHQERRIGNLPDPVKGFSVEEYLAEVRSQLFLRALEKCSGNQTDAAALLGITKQAVNQFVSGRSTLADADQFALTSADGSPSQIIGSSM